MNEPSILMEELAEARRFLERELGDYRPELVLTLGSGLGDFGEDGLDTVQVSLPYDRIPGLVPTTVPGHSGKLHFGTIEGVRVACMQGRFHLYEGHPVELVVRPLRLLQAIGATSFLVTNAAGGIREDLEAGSLMLIADHLNFQGTNPLVGFEADASNRFPDMSEAYDGAWRETAKRVAAELALSLAEGVYVGVLGPSFETPAEIRAFRTLGADAVGMSTVQEVIAARQLDMRVLGLSYISNRAAGLAGHPLSLEEVFEVAERVAPDVKRLIRGCVSALPR